MWRLLPARYYHQPGTCQGDLGYDDSCTRCTRTGKCPAGKYFDSTKCDGSGTEDDSCQVRRELKQLLSYLS